MKKVYYTGQTSTGYPCSDPSNLVVGKEYNVTGERVGSWQTNYTLEGVKGSYNSVWFRAAKPTIFAYGSSIPVKKRSYKCGRVNTFSGDLEKVTTSTVQNVEPIGPNTFIVETLNSIYIVKVFSR